VTTTESPPTPATAAQSASDFHSLTPAPRPYASTEVRYSTTTASLVIVTLCGEPPSVCCHRAAPAAIGELVLIQFHTWGNGFQVFVVTRIVRTSAASTAKPFHPGPLPEATATR
jgi:hypothetical protein